MFSLEYLAMSFGLTDVDVINSLGGLAVSTSKAGSPMPLGSGELPIGGRQLTPARDHQLRPAYSLWRRDLSRIAPTRSPPTPSRTMSGPATAA